MDEPIYRLDDLRVEFTSRRALDVTALALPRGRITAIVGPNGSGKTTLLRVLAFLLPPAAGTVAFDGEPVSWRARDLVVQRRRVTLVAQSPMLFHRSVRANVAYGLEARRLPAGDRDRRIATALAAVGLAGFAERPAWKLSGGEAQRVAIARALVIDPAVYLFDEPTANVDREHVAAIEAVIAALAAAGKTVILTSHNLEQAYRLSDSVLSLVGGRVTAAPLVNVLRGITTASDGTYHFESDGLRLEIAGAPAARAIAIDPEAIILSRAPLHSSARNCVAGTILKAERDGAAVVVTVDCGRALVARITLHSYEELGLNLGAEVWLTFKSSAIHVLG
ncbi:MAG: ABC transporter ATP-binding protein [Deltaproteobacteria bacterium]|nr:ABC transporter ATP-binding protein [Deltaproteobacteria bacterium]